MKKTASKWPSKAINLLVALAMVISLSLILAPAVAAQEEECDPVERFDGCHLEVFVNTYTKDINGDFTPVSEVSEGTYFYVNAVVVNTGNVTADDISGNITLPSGVGLALGEEAAKTWETDINWQALDPDVPGRVAEFWWKVLCIDDNGENEITVTVNAGEGGCENAVGTTSIYQTPPPGEECLYIEIIEAPGWAAPGYTLTFPNALVTPCTNFGVKALVRNDCDYTLNDVTATINESEWGNYASLVGGDPVTWNLGTLYAGEERVVGWTLHCDGQGDVVIRVDGNYAADYGPHNPWTVEQFGAGDLVVEITSPEDGYEVGAGCAPENEFPIEVTVYNNTGETVTSITVQLSGNDTAAFTRTPSFRNIASLAHGSSATVSFTGTCTAYGDVLVTANAGGQGATVYYDADPDTIVIHQKKVLATIEDYDSAANICKTFEIIGSYQNASGGILTGVEMSITWWGNATLIREGADRPYFKKYSGTTLIGEGYVDPVPEVVEISPGVYSATATGIICGCCHTLVYWNFNCTGDEDVEAYTTIEWTGGDPLVDYVDDSETVTINQQWKAHLIVGNVPWLQDEDGLMWNRNAFAPGQNFHVVIPVVNVGEAEAQNVQVTFKILSDPTRWDFVSISGDATIKSWTEGTATGVATIPSIPGNSVKKIIVQLECTGEGMVQFNVMSVVGTDGGTLAPIEADNIEKPPCPLDLYQIPFTVEIVNPFTCDTYNPGDVFAVKAVITNGSSLDLGNVTATLHWDGNAALVPDAIEPNAQENPKTLGNVTADSVHEITWMMECTDPGEVYLWVTAEATTPYYITAESAEVNVHQRDCIDVGIDILSPGPSTYIPTSEEFAVTAVVWVNGTSGQQAEDVYVYIFVDSDELEVLDSPYYKYLGNMDVGSQTTVTWTLHALATGAQECALGDDDIGVYVSTTSRACIPENDWDDVWVSIYPTAHLVTEIVSITPASPFVVCEEFDVVYRIWNTGESDAWEVSATLSVNPDGNIRIAEGEGTYTHYLGTIPGWSYYSGGYFYVEDSFTLHAKEICESPITITPAGNDECGYFWRSERDEFYQIPGKEINAEFIEPAGQTVKVEAESEQIAGDMTEYDINLASGWNLISLPLIPTSTAIGTVLADVDENTNIVWAYDAATATWTWWIPGDGDSTLTTMTDGKGYWINMSAADLLTVTGVEMQPAPYTPKSYPVTVGWNLIGFKSSVARTAGSYLAGISGQWTRIYTYSADTDMYSAVESDAKMYPGKGYWIAVTTAGTIYP